MTTSSRDAPSLYRARSGQRKGAGPPLQARRAQTLTSWKATPAERRDAVVADEHVDPPAVEEGGRRPDALADQHAAARARRTAARAGACGRASLPISTTSPSPTPSPAASSGWISSSGRRSRASEVAVSVKDELRKLCAGEVASLNGCRSSAILVDRPVVGQARHVAPGAAQAVVGERRAGPVRLEAEFSVRKAEAVEEMGLLERRLEIEPARLSPAPRGRRSRILASVQSMISRGRHGKGGMLGADALGERRRSPRDSSGSPAADRSPSARTADAGGRRRCRDRRARGTSSPAARRRHSARCRS